jgi:hypothetical protein
MMTDYPYKDEEKEVFRINIQTWLRKSKKNAWSYGKSELARGCVIVINLFSPFTPYGASVEIIKQVVKHYKHINNSTIFSNMLFTFKKA